MRASFSSSVVSRNELQKLKLCNLCMVCVCTQEYSKSCPLTVPGSVGQSRQVCLSGTLRNQEELELISPSIFDCETDRFLNENSSLEHSQMPC